MTRYQEDGWLLSEQPKAFAVSNPEAAFAVAIVIAGDSDLADQVGKDLEEMRKPKALPLRSSGPRKLAKSQSSSWGSYASVPPKRKIYGVVDGAASCRSSEAKRMSEPRYMVLRWKRGNFRELGGFLEVAKPSLLSSLYDLAFAESTHRQKFIDCSSSSNLVSSSVGYITP